MMMMKSGCATYVPKKRLTNEARQREISLPYTANGNDRLLYRYISLQTASKG